MSANASSCGCNGAGSSGGCGCGGGCGSAAQGSANGLFVRPRFFEGQLLSSEDLQLVVDYVVGKNRLSNRNLFGEGVVCGLAVTCPPCGGMTVTVAGGHALDCCGNDIVVPCPETLDMNSLIRSLRAKGPAGGCEDPCRVTDCDAKDQAATDAAGVSVVKEAARESAWDTGASPEYRYCLYIRYTESAEAPVVPYASGDACDAIACQSSRIAEGHCYELRCPGAALAPVDVFTRLKACIGDLREAAQLAAVARYGALKAPELREAAMIIRKPAQAASLSEADTVAMAEASERLIKLQDTAPDATALRRNLADFELLTIGLARAGRTTGKAAAAVAEARKALAAAAPRIEAAAPLITETANRRAAADLVGMARRTALAEDGAAPDAGDMRLLRAGTTLSAMALKDNSIDLSRLKQWLETRLRTSLATRCDLAARLGRVRLPGSDDAEDSVLQTSADAGVELAEIFLEVLRDCFCQALNPPCPPCEDPAVLLACITVRDCQVIDICNMERRFVLAPRAMRYWLPPVTALGNLVEAFCCKFEIDLNRQPRQRPVPNLGEAEYSVVALAQRRSSFSKGDDDAGLDLSGLDGNALRAIAATGVDIADIVPFATLVARLARLGELSLGEELTLPDISTRRPPLNVDYVAAAQPAAAAAAAEVRSEVLAEVDERLKTQIAAERKQRETALAAATKPARDAEAAVKTIAAENAQLRAELKKLSDAVAKLQK